jgi:uncharacterized protein YodC (DUF2158 family)
VKISVGSVVKLKSGGPVMTVVAVRDADSLDCTWFDRDQKRRDSSFPSSCVAEFVEDDAKVIFNIGADIPGLDHLQGKVKTHA